jgi:hypothetical protein
MQKILENIQEAIKNGKRDASLTAMIENSVVLRHINCQNADCRICMEDHLSLDSLLSELTHNYEVDHLGRYHSWLSKHGIKPETEWGWATEESFDAENIKKYVNDFINR